MYAELLTKASLWLARAADWDEKGNMVESHKALDKAFAAISAARAALRAIGA